MASTSALSLPSVLDTPAAGPLRLALLTAIKQGEPLLLDGSEVGNVGQACLQVLAAGRNAAIGADLGFRIERPSASLIEMATLAGLPELTAA